MAPEAQSGVQSLFTWPEEHRPRVQHNDYEGDEELPVIDMACLQDGAHEARLKVAKDIVAACSEWGFFQLVNHGIPVVELDEVQEQGRRFFQLPMDVKQRAIPAETLDSNNSFGYSFNKSTYKYAGRPWLETFRFCWSPTSSNVGAQAQRVLEGQALEEFQSAVESFCVGAKGVAKVILELCALGLGVAPETFTSSDDSVVRLNSYPACPTPDLTLGLGAHSDPYTLTMLHQCPVGGLQVCRDGKWVTVKPRRGAYVVNVGDTLQAWTNGRFQSAVHRAVLNDKVPRLSVVLFYSPSLDTVISAPPEIVRDHGRRRYRSFTYGEYLDFLKKRDFKREKNETWLQSFELPV